MTAFHQDPPILPHAFDADPLLQEYLARTLPPEVLSEISPELRELGALASGPLAAQQLAERLVEPTLVQWDPWGRRVDRIEPTPLWREAARLAARHGLVAAAYERRHGILSRVHQMAMVYLLEPSMDVYACPLAMTDGAARTLLDLAPRALVERAVPRLTSRDPARTWTSGQWMTERAGGSDVSGTETVARPDGEAFRLWGTKWFSSATTAEMALALARPEGNPPGSAGLALFYLETRLPDGASNGILVNRLKDKLGTRKLPTAELTLDGALALPVVGLSGGVRAISPMLNVTRTWNALVAAAYMARAVALARDYAGRRRAFGTPLRARPLHADTLAALEAEREAGFLLAFRAVELLGRAEAGEADAGARALLRAVTPLAKLTTGKQAVAVASDAIEAFGGAGYVEDTGLPRLLRDAQVLPIWEGTTNVLALEAQRALAAEGAAEALAAEIQERLSQARDPALRPAVQAATGALARARAALAAGDAPEVREAGARRLALTLGRTLALAHLAAHAQWALDAGRGRRATAAARRFARNGVDLLGPAGEDLEDSALLVAAPDA
ncbi:acyl-CoA dehydrogenase domain protein [Anaeromyxobacter dehalogenans 2CP-1]|uniref:Acyl-CoA dehydrogenase domain protein n=1 Tax=Anaeromyxobacter dehalogenans (strain ATCC BAA-258 / DSM 21875 / 2CP-1) TaxID=455488 RepID=B8JGR9_ANAD2|nr:acyl-CoA dehydrogenase family protein [Anaeromyxobacter dehalogenans]ACL66556.1 acyl-CoA dehydrogenase domain protein [Anaeromyxobacter dehalogenans 2CP-1]